MATTSTYKATYGHACWGATGCHVKLLVTPSEPHMTLIMDSRTFFLSFLFLHLFKPECPIYNDSQLSLIVSVFITVLHLTKCFSILYQLGQHVDSNNRSLITTVVTQAEAQEEALRQAGEAGTDTLPPFLSATLKVELSAHACCLMFTEWLLHSLATCP